MAADKIIINTPRFKGEFLLDVEEQPLLGIEWRWIKKISDYLPLTIEEGFAGADPQVYIAFAVIALHRAGKIQKQEALTVAEYLADCPADGTTITFVGAPAGEEEEDPTEPAATPEQTEKPLRSIGGSSRSISDQLEQIPGSIGALA